jgi:cytoskeletal protein CcmA (bactofilin family)
MALVLNDRVKETSTTTGTGTLNLAGAVSGFQTFVAGIGNSNVTYYAIVNDSGTEFEIGIGTVTDASPDTLSRTTILESSNSDSAVNFSSGTKTVFCTLPASKAVFEDADGHVSVPHDLFVAGGLIDLKNDGGAVSQIKFYCESSNAHAQTLIGAPHSESASNTLTLPSSGGSSKLLSATSTATVTNKTFTSPKINEDVAVTSTATELNLLDGVTGGTVSASLAVVVDSNKDIGSFRNVTLTGELDAATLDISGDADIDGTLEADAITIGGTAINTVIAGVTVTNATNAAHVSVADNESTNEENLITFIEDTSATGNVGLESDGDFTYNPSTGTVTATIFKGNIDAVDGDFDGTLEADAITIGGTALNTVIAGVTVTNATTAAVATTVTISDNESTNEDNAIIFTSGGDVDGGNIGLESDGDLTYNPSTGRLTATQLAGTLQTAAQANITSLGTLTTLTVDNVIINGSTIGHTGDTDLMTVASGVLTVAGEVDATSLDISGNADIDGTLEADAITIDGTAIGSLFATQGDATALAVALG